jgi:peptide/nickel transport system permease protein
MRSYALRRLLQGVPLVLFISALVFGLLQLVPGGPLTVYESNPDVRPEDMQRLERQLGLDRPVWVQFAGWLGQMARGNWGYSHVTNRPVLEMIVERLPNTLLLTGSALAVTLILVIPIGVLASVRQYSAFDNGVTVLTYVGLSMPSFWLGLLLIIIFGLALGWFPLGGVSTLGREGELLDRLHHLVLPTAALAMQGIGSHTRYLRASMLDALSQDYVRTARSKGLAERMVVYKHVFRNAAMPLVTNVALDIPDLFTGALITESIFAWPGIGRLYWEAAGRLDYPVLMAVLVIAAALLIVSNLIADLAYALVDPRIRYE